MKNFLFILFLLLIPILLVGQARSVHDWGVEYLFDNDGSLVTNGLRDSVSVHTILGNQYYAVKTTAAQDSIISRSISTFGSGEIEFDVTVHGIGGTVASDFDMGVYKGEGTFGTDSEGYLWSNVTSFTATDTSQTYTYQADATESNEMFSKFKVKYAEDDAQESYVVVWVRINHK